MLGMKSYRAIINLLINILVNSKNSRENPIIYVAKMLILLYAATTDE